MFIHRLSQCRDGNNRGENKGIVVLYAYPSAAEVSIMESHLYFEDRDSYRLKSNECRKIEGRTC